MDYNNDYFQWNLKADYCTIQKSAFSNFLMLFYSVFDKESILIIITHLLLKTLFSNECFTATIFKIYIYMACIYNYYILYV